MRLNDTKGTLIGNILCKLSSNTVKCTSGISTDKLSDDQPYFASIHLQHTDTPEFVTWNKTHFKDNLENKTSSGVDDIFHLLFKIYQI